MKFRVPQTVLSYSYRVLMVFLNDKTKGLVMKKTSFAVKIFFFKTFINCFVFKLVIFLKICYFWINKQTLFLEGFGHSGAFALASRSMLYIIKILKNFTGFEELVRAYFTKELCMNKKSIDRRKRSV